MAVTNVTYFKQTTKFEFSERNFLQGRSKQISKIFMKFDFISLLVNIFVTMNTLRLIFRTEFGWKTRSNFYVIPLKSI